MAAAAPSLASSLLSSLRYAYPALVLVYYIATCSFALCTLQATSPRDGRVRRRPITCLLLVAVCTYVAQVATVVLHSVMIGKWIGEQDAVICLLSCILIYGVELVNLSDAEKPVWHPYIGSVVIALVLEPVLETLSVLRNPLRFSTCPARVVDAALVTGRYLALAAIVILYLVSRRRTAEDGNDSERQALIPKGNARIGNPEASESTQQNSGYGTSDQSDDSTDASNSPINDSESPWERRERESRAKMEKSLREKGNWFTYAKRFLIFFPYIWPADNKALQLRAALVVVCLLANNALNVLIPRQLGIVTDSLSQMNSYNPWAQVLIYAALKLAASDAGVPMLRQWFWIPVEYYSVGSISNAAYSHVLNLSSDFHDSRSSSDILMAIQTGQEMTSILEQICFSAVPMLIDFSIAFVYLSITFGPYEGLITIATAMIFICLATKLLLRMKETRKGEVKAWFHEHYVRQSGIQGWPTVVSFNQIDYEEKRHSMAVDDRVSRTQRVWSSYLFAHAFEYLVLLAGLLAGAFLAVYQVTSGRGTPGQFIMLLTYWAQLVAPLNFFARLGKDISQKLIHAEQLLEIMQTKPSVVNKENAVPLVFHGGNVKFDHVYFSYDSKKQILKDIDLFVPSGETVALVGATGAGKSTILKLIDRFYDATKGSIEIDGQDIRDVDLHSLRAQIGIVPQSPVLFDDTIMNNVRYARLDATDAEVFEACEAACMHEQILGFPEGYNTRVGERGVKLSGGELQRVAIARAILKRPSLVLLDEATSSVDTGTEQKIQAALRALCQGHTTFIVAHRLSTIMNADRILVLAGGEVVEQGSHEDLICANGRYADLWSKQVFIRPSDSDTLDRAQGKKSREAPSNTLDDLSTDKTKSELANASGSSHPAKAMKQSSESGLRIQTGDGAAETPSGHQKEGSRLNPDAPTFTPRTFATALGEAASGTLTTSLTQIDPPAKDPFEEESESPTTAKSIRHPAARPVVAIPNVGRAVLRAADDDDEQQNGLPSKSAVQLVKEQHEADGGPTTGSTRARTSRSQTVKLKHPRYSRRVQSKSEPSTGSGGAQET